MDILSRIVATARQVGADTPAYLELLSITREFLSTSDQDRLKAMIPRLEAMEDQAHGDAQA